MNNLSIILITLCLVQIIASCSSCNDGKLGKSLYPWRQYSTTIKNQWTAPLCWIYSSLAYIEMMYNYNYGAKYTLSIEQVSDNIGTHFTESSDQSCNRSSGKSGGNPDCALKYVSQQGIMTSYMYKLIRKYDIKYITPIHVKNITYPCMLTNLTEQYKCILTALNSTPLLLPLESKDLRYIENDFVKYTDSDSHSILLTDICVGEEGTYIEYQNSWGSSWGCSGFGYVKIVDADGNLFNTRSVLAYGTAATISDFRQSMNFINSNSIENLIGILYVCAGIFMCVLLIGITLFIIKLRHFI